MGTRIRPLQAGDLEDLGVPLRQSFGWQVPPWERAKLSAEEMFDVKHRWFHDVWREWGDCGQVVLAEGRPVAYSIYAPPGLVPGADAWPTAPAGRDAVLLLEMWVAPSQRGHGLARHLNQATVADLVHRGGVQGVECYAHPGRGDSDRLPQALLEALGFHVQRDHATAPRMRLDLKSTRRWVSEVEERWSRIREGVRGKQEPAPGNPAAGSVRVALGQQGNDAGVS